MLSMPSLVWLFGGLALTICMFNPQHLLLVNFSGVSGSSIGLTWGSLLPIWPWCRWYKQKLNSLFNCLQVVNQVILVLNYIFQVAGIVFLSLMRIPKSLMARWGLGGQLAISFHSYTSGWILLTWYMYAWSMYFCSPLGVDMDEHEITFANGTFFRQVKIPLLKIDWNVSSSRIPPVDGDFLET